MTLFAVVAGDPYAALLHGGGSGGGHSFIGLDPFRVIAARDGGVTIDGHPVDGDPWQVLRAELARHGQATVPDLPPFQGGAIGYLGYELARHLEDVPVPPARPGDLPTWS